MGKQTDRYESASKAYQSAMDKYAGEAGWKLALEQGKGYATTAGDVARGSGYKAARTAGYGKAASYALANDAANNAVNSNLNTGVANAQSNNTSTMGMYDTNMKGRAGLDEMEYKQNKDTAAMAVGIPAQIFGMASSDERLKTVYKDNKLANALAIDWLEDK